MTGGDNCARAVAAQPIFSVECLGKRYGGLMALYDVSFEILRGGIFGLIGPNGAGKTTMFNCMAGATRPSSGRMLLADESGGVTEVGGFRPERMNRLGVARTFQNIRLFADLSVVDNVRIGRHARMGSSLLGALLRSPYARREERETMDRAMELLEFVGLSARAAQPAGSLSYGEQRRLEIARALASEPSLLLLDEPAAGMNPRESAELSGLVRAVRESGVTVALIEHDMRLVMSLCEHLVVLDHGVKIAEGSPSEIRDNPDVISAYLGGGSSR